MLTIEPISPFLLSNQIERFTIVVVGAGGTGSFIVQNLARLAAHITRRGGPDLEIVVVDGDRVEEKNIGRQLFGPADVDRNKAMALVTRFNTVFGLQLEAVPEMATEQLLYALIPHYYGFERSAYRILIGAVDTVAGRTAIHHALSSGQYHMWINCGNEEHTGQVVCGTACTLDALHRSFSLGGLCTALPAVPLIYPNVLEEPAQPQNDDCATALERNLQSLMINQMMATIASEYIMKLITTYRLDVFETMVQLETLAMRSRTITVSNVAQACGIEPDLLREKETSCLKCFH